MRKPQKLILDAKGPGEIKASSIEASSDIEILNPDLVICNLDENTNFHMEMTVGEWEKDMFLQI